MSYTISFFTNGYGQQPNSISNVNTIPELPILVEDGFTFGGWYLDEDLTIQAEVGAELTSDITLYACWIRERGYANANTYTNTLKPSLGPDIDITPSEPGSGGGTSEDTSQVDSYFLQLVNSTKTNIEDLKSRSGRANPITYTNFIKAGSSLSGYPPMEAWRSVSFDGFKYKASDNTIKSVEFLSRMSLPYLTSSNLRYEKAGSSADTTIDITPYMDGTSPVGLTFVSTVSGSATTTKVKITETLNTYNVPKFIIFELQAAGGGGGSSGSDSKNGAGGGGGGFVTGVLKLDFSVFSKYRIILGKYGAGGTDKNTGGFASNSSISGVKSDGTEVLLIEPSGGAGGYCHNYSDWAYNDRYDRGGVYCPTAGKDYIFSYKLIGGGAGGYTNGWLDCTGVETKATTAYYTEVESYKNISGWYKSYPTQAGGDSGSSGESGGGGAAALGSGGRGGLTASKGSNGNGYGSGGGGGRWTIGGIAKAGGDGAPAYVAIYY